MNVCPQCGHESQERLRYCPNCGAPVAEAVPQERKVATLVFADLVDSTVLGEQDPERVRALLDRFYDAMAAEIQRAGGTIEKFAGDAVMAAFGAPAAQEDHAERALHAALAMQRRQQELFADELRLRIGVNTGEVVVGRAREGSSFVSGDAVNTAARLEQAAGPGEILAGERTVGAARGAFEFEGPTTVAAKGKPDGIHSYRVVRALTLVRPRGVAGLRRAFVGRESELSLLRATYRHTVDQREAHLVTIVGDSGVGKTRLVGELWEWLPAQQPKPLRRTGRCLSYGRGITYWPLGEVLKEHLGIREADAPEMVRRRLGRREILGLTLGLDTPSELHPLAARDSLHDAWVDFFGDLVHEQPVVVFVEDVNWAEDDLLDLLERLVRDVHGPLLLIGTARPELLDRRPSWGGGRRNSSLLWLEPLTNDDTQLLLHELLAADLPEQLRAALVGRAEGNPFFVEELVSTLIDHRVLERSNGSWAVHDLPAPFAIPDSVHALVAARLDLLPPLEKAALQAAAVIGGRVFWATAVTDLLDGADPDFDLLEDRDFIRRRAGSSRAEDVEYAIKHALTREVAYAGLPKARRAQLHAKFADWLERASESKDERASLLAHHYAEAVHPDAVDLAWRDDPGQVERLRERAVEWLERAAELAVGRYEIDNGIALLGRALELEPPEAKQAELWRRLGNANALKFDGEAFWTAMQSSLKVCRDPAVCAETYSELAFHTAARSTMWKRRPDRELVHSWVRRALETSEPDSPARVRALVARAYLDRAQALDAAQEASKLAERLDDPELRSFAFEARSIVAYARGDFDDSCTWAERRLDLLGDISDPDHRADVFLAPYRGHLARGRITAARRCVRLHEAVARSLTPHHRVHAVGHVVTVEQLAGGWETIRANEERAVETVEANLETPCLLNPQTLLACALAAAVLGDEERSRQLEERALALGMEGYDVALEPSLVQLAILRDDLETVARLLEVRREDRSPHLWAQSTRLDGLGALRDRDRVEEEAPALLRPHTYLEPFALRALGRVRDDDELVRQSIDRFADMDLRWHGEQTESLLR
ncbi:MAG TPA: adenylate/guanylate cyclase domain-containing protein [Gaiellaceae bacterium]|nr:adenylate/guanylate cyclase domain-containing protein [Gaiellaceae bacterium]